MAPDRVESLQYAIRATARTSFVLFLVVFLSPSLAKHLPAVLTRSLMKERRYVGLSFAASHLFHAIALVIYVRTAPEAFWAGRTPATNIPGFIGYLMILLLAITSFAMPARVIGPANWKKLHFTGVWILAVIFALSFLTRAHHDAAYLVPGVLMVAAMLVRMSDRFAA
ncbi:ferric reductase-like transmembrane domain-containing protein [Burkholderia sp. IMCC1007]|uniref:ferric reductase-like transmembrane domain-containing protein n=1 Tax=Burkholderia sp. IMCC1007 TaxID=3004104 RepID=UPI0022B43ED3|nr:ferric reductase-like transmembrane domain-containing protein [Burkholderia sp. IMCC1007]